MRLTLVQELHAAAVHRPGLAGRRPRAAPSPRWLTAGVEPLRYEGMEQDEAGVWTAPGGARIVWFQDPDGNTLSLTAA